MEGYNIENYTQYFTLYRKPNGSYIYRFPQTVATRIRTASMLMFSGTVLSSRCGVNCVCPCARSLWHRPGYEVWSHTWPSHLGLLTLRRGCQRDLCQVRVCQPLSLYAVSVFVCLSITAFRNGRIIHLVTVHVRVFLPVYAMQVMSVLASLSIFCQCIRLCCLSLLGYLYLSVYLFSLSVFGLPKLSTSLSVYVNISSYLWQLGTLIINHSLRSCLPH